MLSNDVFDQVYTLLKVAMGEITYVDDEGEDKLKYEDLTYSRSTRMDEEPTLPCLFAKQISSVQVGNSLENRNQNGINSTFQIESYSNISYDEAFEIINDAGNIMNQLGYTLMYGIEEMSSQTVWRFVARFNRVIGSNELPLSFG